MSAENLELPLERWLKRERDKPKGITFRAWSDMVELICVHGGVPFEASAMLADLHACVPSTKRLSRFEEATEVELTHWRWWWEMKRPDLLRAMNAKRTQETV